MAINATKITFSGLARKLVADGHISEEEAEKALANSHSDKIPFINYLVQNKIISSNTIAHITAIEFGLPLLDLNAFDTELIPTKYVNEKLIRNHQVLPLFKRGDLLFLAMADPTNQTALEEIKFNTGLNTNSIIVEADKLFHLIEKVLAEEDTSAFTNFEDTDLDNLELKSDEEEMPAEVSTSDAEDAPIVRAIHKILLDAVRKGASDLHFEPYEKTFRVRFRQDGILYEVANLPVSLSNRIASRLKIMSQLDISERRIPQDGRFKLILSKKRSIDFRVNTCPTTAGEKVVMRILDPTSATIGIDALGYESFQKELFLKNIKRPQGLILVTGPTGSGKTVSLYTALNILNTPEINICTAEDPVEINLPGINQVNINNKTGLTFATALRSFLRQDPDVIMVGEMRDLETAEIGIKAAQTGHLVLSTLHTNSAPETLSRLVNMGVAPFNIATSVSLIIAQRLARRLCERCKRPETIPKNILLKEGFTEEDLNEDFVIYAPVGCENCTSGYKGRTGIYELLSLTETIGQAIMAGSNSLAIAKQAIAEGMQTLRRSGIRKIMQGITSLEEVNRVTKD